MTVETKELHMQLPIKRDRKFELMAQHMRKVVTSTFSIITLPEQVTGQRRSVTSTGINRPPFICLLMFGKLRRQNDTTAVTNNQRTQTDRVEDGNQKVYN